ncbi:hypothetical protein OAO87_02075 [bacterium]|nr:hypothetical protein [bacterium]
MGQLIPHEKARSLGLLYISDTIDDCIQFAAANPFVFISHQWLSQDVPDPERTHFRALCQSVEALCTEFEIAHSAMHVWVE